jgi:16S rRNA (uracil1498-N3)-methyltransferase
MRVSRLYQNAPLSSGECLTLDARASHYVSRVLRLSVQSSVIVFDGAGHACDATIVSMDRTSVTVRLGLSLDELTESPLSIHLYQGVCRGEKMDFVLQKSVELGVSEITPLMTERTEVKLSPEKLDKRMAHWRGVVISACEQSGRVRVPRLNAPQPVSTVTLAGLACVCDPRSSVTLRGVGVSSHAALLIGPEGGFSESEVDRLVSQGAHAVSLGPRVLRTETAALAALSALQTLFGDFT